MESFYKDLNAEKGGSSLREPKISQNTEKKRRKERDLGGAKTKWSKDALGAKGTTKKNNRGGEGGGASWVGGITSGRRIKGDRAMIPG